MRVLSIIYKLIIAITITAVVIPIIWNTIIFWHAFCWFIYLGYFVQGVGV